MKSNIEVIKHRTKVTYSYVDINSNNTFTETKYLEGWVKNISFITNKLKDETKHIYSINSIEHVSTKYKMPLKEYYNLSVADLESERIVHKIR